MISKIYDPVLPCSTIVYLIRHDFSIAQDDKRCAQTLPDNLVGVHAFNSLGIRQCIELLAMELPDQSRVIIKRSPYLRATQTADQVCNALNSIHWLDLGEDLSLREIECGWAAGLSAEELKEKHLAAYNDRQKYETQGAKAAGSAIYSRHFHGESYAVVYDRLKQCLLSTCAVLHGLNESRLVIFAHGLTNRVIASLLCGMNSQEIANLRNPDNCEIWKIEIPEIVGARPSLISITCPERSFVK